MIKIISFKICPFVQRITALLEAKQQPYEVEYIDLNNKPAWFLDISPNGQVPVLVTSSGDNLFESDAIAEYLDELYSPLQAKTSPEQRAKDRAWSYQATKHYLTQCSAQRSPDAVTLANRSEKLNQAFTRIEQELDDGPFFNGASLGNVDIAWLPLLHRAALIEKHSGYDFLENFPKIKTWQNEILNTGVAEKSVAEDFETKFIAFYLSNETYLGVKGGLEECDYRATACC